jgi:chemotaxis protein methyltransferase CheR
MIEPVSPCDLNRFSAAITWRLGLHFEEAKLGFLGEVLQRRLEALKRPAATYLRKLETEPDAVEIGLLAQELTIGETYFFRNIEQFHALAETVLPDRMRVQAAARTLRILSAACASGEEPYSIAISVADAIPDPAWQVSIRAVDLNPEALEKARRGRYSAWSLRETTAEARRRWFRQDGRDMILDEAVRAAVAFEPCNLAAENADIWQPAAYDVVFCRNVLMYFSPEQSRAAIARIARSLAPGGYLFLGHAETLRGVSEDFHLRHTHGAFYYERKGQIGRPIEALAPLAVRPGLAPIALETFGAAWVDTIREASERVETLVTTKRPARTSVSPTARPWDLGLALDLMRTERFTEALTSVRSLPPESGGDPDALLLEAMLLAHGGEFPAAEAVCQRLLRVDDLNAGAHYALALCRDSVGDRNGAAEHDRVATYLDPAFAMPRLHLGLIARHLGDRAGARLELGKALSLLKHEEASRLLLFAGGFSRDALIALCRSALQDCGRRP